VKDAVPPSRTDGSPLGSDAPRTDGSGDGAAGAIGTGMGGSGGSAGSGLVDAPPPPPDGAGTCGKDQECAPGYCIAGRCGPCTAEFCSGITATPFCGPAGLCVRCLASKDCEPGSTAPLCLDNACVGCGMQPGVSQPDAAAPLDAAPPGAVANVCSAQPQKSKCEASSGRCVQCLQHQDCTTETPICNGDFACGPCTMDDQCKTRDSAKPACGGGKCVECTKNEQCGDPKKPMCGDDQLCHPCRTDSDCVARLGAEPGICMNAPFLLGDPRGDGHCATAAETIYVDNSNARCISPAGVGDGSPASPFCGVNEAIKRVDKSHQLVLVRGPTPVAAWEANAGTAFAVIGKNGAGVNPGAAPGVHINGRDVLLRGLTVKGGTSIGVFAEGSNAVLRLDRCYILANLGGVLVNGTSYAITNTVIADNMQGHTPQNNLIGGVSLDSSGAGSKQTTEFRFNTVFHNIGGITCRGNYQLKSALVTGNGLDVDVVGCTADSHSVVGGNEPPLGADYHLGTTSGCNGRGNATEGLGMLDIDGDPRPRGDGTTDCGADQLK
jgi:hypothetical protein